LLAQGHPDARSYTIGQVWDEAEIVVERLNRAAVTDAVLIQGAVASLLSKEGGKEFSKLTKMLTGEG
jgi:hypothetical protein